MALKKRDVEAAITPTGDRLFVRMYKPAEEMTTEGGVVITRQTMEREVETLVRAQIIKCGPDANPCFKPGQFIVYPRFSGMEISTTDLADATISYYIISGGDNAGCVCCIVEDSYARAELGLDEPRTITGARRTKVAI